MIAGGLGATGRNLNGTWSLYAVDLAAGGSGAIVGGWSLEVTGTPDNTFKRGKIKRNKRKGTATVAVTVPGPGVLKVLKKSATYGSTVSVPAAGTYNLTIKPRKSAANKLRRKRKVKASASIGYTPTGGFASSQKLKLTFKKKR
jgi:hypothetical protein